MGLTPRPRRIAGWACCSITLASLTALGAILVVLAASDPLRNGAQSLLFAAIAFDMMALLVFAVVASLLMKQMHGHAATYTHTLPRRLLDAAFIILSLLATVLSFVSLARTRSAISTSVPVSQRGYLNTLVGTAIALCALFLLSQIAFFALTFAGPKQAQEVAAASGTDGSVTSEWKESPRSDKSRDVYSPDELDPMSPVSAFSDTPPRRGSLRDSVNHFLQPVIQPMTSKSRLMRHASIVSSTSHHSRDSSWGNRAEDEHDNWEIPELGDDARSNSPAIPPVTYPSRARLAPIPASRPPSPARPLDGPFPLQDADNDDSTAPPPPAPPPPPFTAPSQSNTSTSSLAPHPFTRKNSLPPPSAMGARSGRRVTPPSASHSRQSSIGDDGAGSIMINAEEAHIHPLFRTESPSPAPVITSPGTVVTGSPWGGQVVSTGLPDASTTSTITRPGSARGGAGVQRPIPALRSVRSEETWTRGLGIDYYSLGTSSASFFSKETNRVDASMPPTSYQGVLVRRDSVY